MIDLKHYTQLTKEDFRKGSSYSYYKSLVDGIYFYLGNLWLMTLTESPKLEDFSRTAMLNAYVAFSDDPDGIRGIGVHSGNLKEVVGPHLAYATSFFLVHNISIAEQYLKNHLPRPSREKRVILEHSRGYKSNDDTNFVDYYLYELQQNPEKPLTDNLSTALKTLSKSADLRHKFVHDRFNESLEVDINKAIESWINAIVVINDLDKAL